MSFLFVQVRPVGDKRGSWYIQCSNSPGSTTYRDADLARQSVIFLAECYPSLLVVVHDRTDKPSKAFAVKEGRWRKLDLLVKSAK